MSKNVGMLDRAIRIGTALILIALSATNIIGSWGWIGIVPLATGLSGWCPAYTLLSIKTCRTA